MSLLICAQDYDEPHIKSVCSYLKTDYFFYERYRTDHFFTYNNLAENDHNNNDHSKCILQNNDDILNLFGHKNSFKNINAVYWRPKAVISSELPSGSSDQVENFCMNQWRAPLNFISEFLNDKFWVNPISSGRSANNKILQLHLAKQLDLNVPKTVISNKPSDIMQIFENSENVIYKPVSPHFGVGVAIFTNKITSEMIKSNLYSVTMSPGIYQELIDKDHELRVTIVNDKVYTLRINSQNSEITSLDWRRDHSAYGLEKAQLTKDTESKLLAFHKKMGLVIASYDFIFDMNGREIFLECNPDGQWYFTEEIGESIAQSIASLIDSSS